MITATMKSAVASVPPEDVVAYLTTSNWHKVSDAGQSGSVWAPLGADSATDVLVPSGVDFGDYPERILTLLATVSRLKMSSLESVISDVLRVGVDVMRVHCPQAGPVEDSILLSRATRAIENAAALVTAAAVTSITRRPVLSPRRPPQAVDFLNRVRFGHTERGSLVLTIISRPDPLNTPGAPGLLELMEEPFPRRAFRNIITASKAALSAADSYTATGTFNAFDESVQKGVSAELCDALAGLGSVDEGEKLVSIDITWSTKVPIEPEFKESLVVTTPNSSALSLGAQHLRQTAPLTGLLLSGVVVNLHREQTAQAGLITVSTVVEGNLRQLRVQLKEDDYAKAIDAHRMKRGVLFAVDVVQHGRTYYGVNLTKFEVMP